MQTKILLHLLNIPYIPMTSEQIYARKLDWICAYIPSEHHQKVAEYHCLPSIGGYSDYLWHAFSFELLHCLGGDEARNAFDGIYRGEAILISNWDEEGFYIPNASRLTANELDKVSDVVISGKDFKWTYAKTHESLLGPYFYMPSGM